MIIMASPSRYCWYSGTSNSDISALIRSCPGPIHAPPRSTHEPSARTSVYVRPPTRSRASSNVTEWPACCNRSAAVNPANPAPTTQKSTSAMVRPFVSRRGARSAHARRAGPSSKLRPMVREKSRFSRIIGPGALTLFDDRLRPLGPSNVLFFVGDAPHQRQIRTYPRRRGQEFRFTTAVENPASQSFVTLYFRRGPVAPFDDHLENRCGVADVEGLHLDQQLVANCRGLRRPAGELRNRRITRFG